MRRPSARQKAFARRGTFPPPASSSGRPLRPIQVGRLLFSLLLCVGASAAAADQTAPPGRGDLSPRDRADLLQKLKRFESLSPQQQRRIRELHGQVERDEKGAELLAVAERYYRWLKRQTPGLRAELRQLGPDERIARIRRMRAAERAKEKQTLSEADQKAVIVWLRGWIVRHGRGKMLADWSARAIGETDQTGSRDRPRHRPPGGVPADRFRRVERMEMMARLLTRVRPERWMQLLEPEDLRRLVPHLSPAARDAFEAMPSLMQRKRLVVQWVRQSIESALDRPPVTDHHPTQEELETFFAEALKNNDLREELLALPRDEMLRALRRLAARHRHAPRPLGSHRPAGR